LDSNLAYFPKLLIFVAVTWVFCEIFGIAIVPFTPVIVVVTILLVAPG
jgi:hypothetical protein